MSCVSWSLHTLAQFHWCRIQKTDNQLCNFREEENIKFCETRYTQQDQGKHEKMEDAIVRVLDDNPDISARDVLEKIKREHPSANLENVDSHMHSLMKVRYI